MSDFTNEFDAIFKDVVGRLEPTRDEPITEKEPEYNYDDIAKDLVRFASRLLQDDKELQMYGIHHIAHYIDHIKRQYERGVIHQCKCGTKISFIVEEDVRYWEQPRHSHDPLRTNEYYDFMTNRYISRRFCPICGMSIAVAGKIISMSAEGVDFNK